MLTCNWIAAADAGSRWSLRGQKCQRGIRVARQLEDVQVAFIGRHARLRKDIGLDGEHLSVALRCASADETSKSRNKFGL